MSTATTSATQLNPAFRVLAIVLFVGGAAILFVRFPPSDLTGWIASSLGTTLGVPFFLATAFFAASWRIAARLNGFRVVRIASLALAVVSAIAGALLLFTTP